MGKGDERIPGWSVHLQPAGLAALEGPEPIMLEGETPLAKMVALVAHVHRPSLPGGSGMRFVTQTRGLIAVDSP